MTLGQRIREVREEQGISRAQLAQAAGLSSTTLSDLELDRSKSTTKLHRIAGRLRVNVAWLETGRGPKELVVSDDEWTDVDAYSQHVALGDGAVAEDHVVAGTLRFKTSSLQRKGLLGHRLGVFYGDGDSMSPRINDGDAFLVDFDDTRKVDGKIYYLQYDGMIYAKRLEKIGREWFITSDNKVDPKWKKPVEIDHSNDFQIHGRVRWIASWDD